MFALVIGSSCPLVIGPGAAHHHIKGFGGYLGTNMLGSKLGGSTPLPEVAPQ